MVARPCNVLRVISEVSGSPITGRCGEPSAFRIFSGGGHGYYAGGWFACTACLGRLVEAESADALQTVEGWKITVYKVGPEVGTPFGPIAIIRKRIHAPA